MSLLKPLTTLTTIKAEITQPMDDCNLLEATMRLDVKDCNQLSYSATFEVSDWTSTIKGDDGDSSPCGYMAMEAVEDKFDINLSEVVTSKLYDALTELEEKKQEQIEAFDRMINAEIERDNEPDSDYLNDYHELLGDDSTFHGDSWQRTVKECIETAPGVCDNNPRFGNIAINPTDKVIERAIELVCLYSESLLTVDVRCNTYASPPAGTIASFSLIEREIYVPAGLDCYESTEHTVNRQADGTALVTVHLDSFIHFSIVRDQLIGALIDDLD